MFKNCLEAWQPYQLSLGTGGLVHFYLLSHRELDIHSENAFIPLLNCSNVLKYENHFWAWNKKTLLAFQMLLHLKNSYSDTAIGSCVLEGFL